MTHLGPRAALAVLTSLVVVACGDSPPTSPSAVSGDNALTHPDGGTQSQPAHHNPGHGGGPGGGPGGGGGGGTADDFLVTFEEKLDMSPGQPMQGNRDNKKALAASGPVPAGALTTGFSSWITQANCDYTGKDEDETGAIWSSADVEDLKRTMMSPLGRRDVSFSIQHSGDGTGLASVRMLANPEGSDNWLSYCFNTGFGLCSSQEVAPPVWAEPGARAYQLDGAGIRAVKRVGPNDHIELACPDTVIGSPDVTIVVEPVS